MTTNLIVAKQILDIVNSISTENWNERFSEERYLDEGPNKHTQQDEAIQDSLMRMYEEWAVEISNEELENSKKFDNKFHDDFMRFLCEKLYAFCGFGIKGVNEKDWDHFYNGTLSTSLVKGLTKSPPDKKTLDRLFNQITPTISLLLQAGISVEQIVDVVKIVPVEEVQTSLDYAHMINWRWS